MRRLVCLFLIGAACTRREPAPEPAKVSEAPPVATPGATNDLILAPVATSDGGVLPTDGAPESPAPLPETYVLNSANTKISFVGSKIGGSHSGTFRKVSGTLSYSRNDSQKSKLQVLVDVASLKTDSEKLDAHLRSSDFFDCAKFPTATFRMTSLEAQVAKADMFTSKGVMDIKGTRKQIAIPAKVTVTSAKIAAVASFSISRKEFHIDFDGASDYLIKDPVSITVHVDVERVAAP